MTANRSVFVRSDDEGTHVAVIEPDGSYRHIDGVVSVNFAQENQVVHAADGVESVVPGRPGKLDVVMLASAAFQFDETQVNVIVQGEEDVHAYYNEGFRGATRNAVELLKQSYLSKRDVITLLERAVREHEG